MFDVGGNLGLMAIPILRNVPNCNVVSFEPSPNSLPSLRQTVAEADLGNRWQLVEKAVGRKPGSSTFSVSRPSDGLFDGLKSTGRVDEVGKTTVEVTTIDAEWEKLGCPAVSAIKIDVEGSELDVLAGATECLKSARPTILFEWNAVNLAAYDVEPSSLLQAARSFGYDLYALPSLVPVRSGSELKLQMIMTESFLLAPSMDAGTGAC